MRDHADVVVIGAGIMGLSIAYHLARRGTTNVLVVDRGYLCGGASGRNGGGIRAQWSSEANVRLMQESIRMCQDFASEFKINVWLRQGGYLFLARSEERRRALEASCKLQRECGLTTQMLSPREAQKIVPELDTDGIVAASFNPDDGVVFPWPFVWGYAEGARRCGVEIAEGRFVESGMVSRYIARFHEILDGHARVVMMDADILYEPSIYEALAAGPSTGPSKTLVCTEFRDTQEEVLVFADPSAPSVPVYDRSPS